MSIRPSHVSESAHPGLRVTKNSNAPIFITGFARSGTTWVNELLRDYFDVGLVNEGQFIINFGRYLKRYGDLHNKNNLERLVGHLSRDEFFLILNKNYSIAIDWDAIRRADPEFSEIVREILKQIAQGLGKSRIGSKYPVFGRHLDLLRSLFPDCRIVHVIRDGRDCALSHKAMIWGHQNTCASAMHWRRYLQTIRMHSHGMSDQYLELRYEDLLLTPDSSLCRLEKFITGEDGGVIAHRISTACNLPCPDRAARWSRDMRIDDQAIFESVAGDVLQTYGYPLTGTFRPVGSIYRMAAWTHDRFMRELLNLYRKIFRLKTDRKPW